jgi:SsrA-binding protein
MKVINRRARTDYRILDILEAGIKLTGPEVKSVKEGRIDLTHAFVKVKDGQALLLNAHIEPYLPAGNHSFETNRTRRLLLRRKEALALETKMAQARLTTIPISCYTKRGLVKLKIGLAKGKKRWEKRETIKKRDLEREIKRELDEGM